MPFDSGAWSRARPEVFWENADAGKSNMTDACGGGKTVPLCHKGTVSGDA